MTDMLYMAQSAAGDSVSGNVIIGIIGAVAAGISLVLGKRAGLKEASEKVTIKPPLPDIEVSKKFSPPTWHQHMALERRVGALEADTKQHREYVEGQLREIRHDNNEQFVKLMHAGETRKDAIMDSMNDMVRNFHARVDQLIDGHRTTNTNEKP